MTTRENVYRWLGFGAVAIVACACVVAVSNWGVCPPQKVDAPSYRAVWEAERRAMIAEVTKNLVPPVITPGTPMTDEEVDLLARPPLWPKDE